MVILLGPLRTFATHLNVPVVLTVGVTLVHLSFAVVLVFVLWTGTPMFRYATVFYLVGAAVFSLPSFLFEPVSVATYSAGVYGGLCVATAVVLLVSPGVRRFLAARENARLNIDTGSGSAHE